MPIHTIRSEPQVSDALLFGLPMPPADPPQLPEGISLCMIVKNEERFLEECLKSVEGIVDEINILDTGSTDRTLEIAARYGARVEHSEWRNDFSWARNKALAMATKRWTLVLDGDEEIAPESRRALLDLRTVPAGLTVLYCRINNDLDEHGTSAMMSHSLPRIFPTSPRIRYRGLIHESLCVDDGETKANAVVTPVRILHKGYRLEIIGGRKKNERNAPLLQRATEIDGDDSFAWFNYGNYLLGGENWDEGIKALERMIELEGENDMRGFVPLGYVTLASAYAGQRGDFEKALKTIDDCLEKTPDYVLATYAKGEILARANRLDDARTWYEKSIGSKNHEDRYLVVDEEIVLWKAHYNIAATYMNEGRHEEALPWLEMARKNKPDIWPVYERLAFVFENLKRYFDAEIILREAFERFGSESAAAAYINYLVRRQRMTRALEVIEEALPAAEGQTAVALNVAAAALAKRGNGDPTGYLRAALKVSPGAGLALVMLDQVYAERGEELARARLRRDEFEAPLLSGVDYERRTSRLLEERRLPEAIVIAEDGVVRYPGNSVVLFNLGLALAQTEGQTARAIEVLGRLRIGERDVMQTAAFLRASLLEKENRVAEALDALYSVFGEDITQADAILLRARLLEKLGRLDDAERGLRDALQTGGKRVALELAAMMLRAGRMEEARGIATETLAVR